MKQILQFLLPFLFFSTVSFSQGIIQGVVQDNLGLPVPGATVVIKGSKAYALADSAGNFKLEAKETLPFTLVISYAGYKDREIEVYEYPEEPFKIKLLTDGVLNEVVVTSRRRKETAQEVPIPISVIGGGLISEAGAFNVNRVKELVPSVQLYSSNPRNTTLNIRGLGSTFGLTNDGIDPGVGFYVDGVYYARPAATTLDFIDVEQIEVLRGPQGTLFGKNTTAGAFNVTTRKPTFKPSGLFELSYGNYGFVQAKSSISGPVVADKLAARVSFSGTQRDGLIKNIATNTYVNELNNLGIRGQVLYTPTANVNIIIAADATRQRPNGYATVFAGVVPTQRPAYRQFNQIIADLNYKLPSTNPFDRVIDQNTASRSDNDLGGVSLNVDAKIGPGTLTSTSAWRYWNWSPSNDRDFTGLPVLTLSQATSKQTQFTQEIRYAGEFSSRLSGVLGVFAIGQEIVSAPVQIEEAGSAQWRFSQSTTSDLWKTPGLFDNYGIKTTSKLNTFGAAIFGQLDWKIFKGLHLLPGIRFNYDKKKVDFLRETYGGLQTTNPDLLALKNMVYSNQVFQADAHNNNLSGHLTIAYKASQRFNFFATYSTTYKPIGVNLGGLPTDAKGPLLDLAIIKPEYVTHYEMGLKTTLTPGTTVNLTVYNTDIRDFQTQVQTAQLGVNRGYLANAEKVRVQGLELDADTRIGRYFSLTGALSYTDGKYVSFTNAPVPLEETGAPAAFKDISGGVLPGISKWAGSLGGEVSAPGKFFGQQKGKYFLAFNSFYRSSFSSSPSPSRYLNIDGYTLLNGRIGFRVTDGLSAFLWARNLLNKNYFEQLLPAAGNAGQYAAVLGDQRTYGITIRYGF